MRRTFTLLRTLGRGAHGSVHLAEMRDEDDGYVQTLAIKRLLPEWTGDRDLVVRLRDEAKLLALLHHEHVVRVHGLTQIDGGLAILMEPIEGVDLGRVYSRCGALEPRVALEIVAAIADALDAAWCTVAPGKDAPLAVVHRDIKPSNVMLTSRGGVKVMDFGVARATFDSREAETKSQQFGTARYMAPERWLDGRADHKSDVFSLGVTLIEIATGTSVPRLRLSREAFAEDTERALALIAWEPMRELAAHLVAFDPEARPTAAEVASAALALLPAAPGPPLRVWARDHVMIESGEQSEATATVTVIQEDTVSPSQRSMTGLPAPGVGGREGLREGFREGFRDHARRWVVPAALSVLLVVLLAYRTTGTVGPVRPAPEPQPVPVEPFEPEPPFPTSIQPDPVPVVEPRTAPLPVPVVEPEPHRPVDPPPSPAPARPVPPPEPPVAPAPAPATAEVQFELDRGLEVRTKWGSVRRSRGMLNLPAEQTLTLVVVGDGRERECTISVPARYTEIQILRTPDGKIQCIPGHS